MPEILALPEPDPVRRKPDPRRPPKYLTQSQMESLRTASKPDPRAYALFGLMYTYGLRISEACRLKLEDVDLKRRRITIYRSKNGRSLEYPIPQPQAEALKRYLKVRQDIGTFLFVGYAADNQHGITPRMIGYLFTRYAKLAGIEGHGPHSLRHSAAVHAIEAGISLPMVSELLGHSNMKSTQVYAAVTSKARDAMVEKLADAEEVVRW